MSSKPKLALGLQKEVIKTEIVEKQNSATRIGTMIEDLIDSMLTLQDNLSSNLAGNSTSVALTQSAGKVLKDAVDSLQAQLVSISLILQSNDIDLDDFQEIVDAINALEASAALLAGKPVDVTGRSSGKIVEYDETLNSGNGGYKHVDKPSVGSGEDFIFSPASFGTTTTLDLEEESEPKHEFTANSLTTNLVLTNKKTGSSKGLLKVNFSGIVSLAITLDPAFTHRQAGKYAITTHTLKQANGESDYIDYVINGTIIDWFFPDIDELAQDAVGIILDDGTVGDINFNYNDVTPKISGTIKNKSVTYAKIDGTTGTTERVLSTTAVGDVQSTTEIQPYKRDDLLTILDGATWTGDTYTVTGQTPNNGLQGQFTLNVTTHYKYDCVIDGQWTRTPLARSWVNVDGVPSTEKTKLETTGNWTAKEYIGTAITGTFQGQRHYDSDYLFLAVSDNIWIRTARA